jgi:hypothetical protein
MKPTNGHADAAANVPATAVLQPPPASSTNAPKATQLTATEIKGMIGTLEVPFAPSVIEWRVTNTTKDGPPRGQVVPYADQRAYTDRLNAVFSPAGWTRNYVIHTSANFQRDKDQKTVAKVFVTCELTIFGIGSHSATGEEWADNDNAGTAAEAQAFKRACACLGLGRYLYYFSGIWVDLDGRKRPKSVPKLPAWATPEGWKAGLRPTQAECESPNSQPQPKANHERPSGNGGNVTPDATLVSQIEALAEPLGRGLYRGLLKTVAHVWKPTQIADPALLKKVLEHMQAAERGLRRLDQALNRGGPEALSDVLRSLQLRSFDQVQSLETLKKIVLALEAKQPTKS